ncbi:MAG: heme exporter protein CcmB [Candidatus Binatia bacterium]
MLIVRQIYWLLWKDLLLEIRRRESLISMFFFGTVLLFLFNFSFEIPRDRAAEMAPGLLWLAFIFTGTLGLNQLFQMERENQCLDALLLCPMDRGALYLAKVFFNLTTMLLVEVFVFPLFWVLFNLDFWELLPSLFLVAFLGTVGFCVLGTLLSAVTLKARARELLLPLILFPFIIPVFLATIRAMEIILHAGNFQELLPWLRLLIGFDVIFITVGFLVFEWVIEG